MRLKRALKHVLKMLSTTDERARSRGAPLATYPKGREVLERELRSRGYDGPFL